MKRILAATMLALALNAPVVAHATEPLLAKLAHANAAVKDAAPQFACYDPTDKATCQEIRSEYSIPDGGVFSTIDFPDGLHDQCFSPGWNSNYRVCSGGWGWAWPETLNNGRFVDAPFFDSRCDHWGGPYSAEYLACEAALPPKHAD